MSGASSAHDTPVAPAVVTVPVPGQHRRTRVPGPEIPGPECSAGAQQGRLRVGQERADVADELRPQFTVDDPVVEGHPERGDVPYLHLALVYPRLFPDRPEAQDRGFAGRQDRGTGV